MARVSGDLRKPDGETGVVAKLQMRCLGRNTLHLGEEIAVKAKLQDVLGGRACA